MEESYVIPEFDTFARMLRKCLLASMIAMLVVGCVSLLLFVAWELLVATKPVIPARFLSNRSVVLTSLIGFFDFVSPSQVPDKLMTNISARSSPSISPTSTSIPSFSS